MAEATEFTIGAEASCTDGVCGEVRRIVIDPAARTVTHLVIEPEHHPESGRLVPVHLVDATAGEVRLSCTLAEFGKLDRSAEVELSDVDYGGGYGEAEAVQGYGDVGTLGVGGSSVSGMGIGMGLGHHVQTHTEEVVPLGEAELRPGERVHALDADIGEIQGFLVDPGDQHVTYVLLKEGHLWGRKEVAIPISAVKRVDIGIWLNITKKQVEELPPVS
jgi:sporulation protein YlmC with PRC-barrel domain